MGDSKRRHFGVAPDSASVMESGLSSLYNHLTYGMATRY